MEGYIAQILMFAGNFAPRNWAYCAGQTIAIAQNQALFSLIGTIYGGDGQTTFKLPDFRDRIAVGTGAGPGLSNYAEGQTGGSTMVTVTQQMMAAHTHPVTAHLGVSTQNASSDEGSGSVLGAANFYAAGAAGILGGIVTQPTDNTGGNQPLPIVQPVLGMNYVICLYGIYPSKP